MTNYKPVVQRAELLQALESEPTRQNYWSGFLRGARRGHFGYKFGSQAEHDAWMNGCESNDETTHWRGIGYMDGYYRFALWDEQPDKVVISRYIKCNGLSDSEIGEICGVTNRTSRNWKNGARNIQISQWRLLITRHFHS